MALGSFVHGALAELTLDDLTRMLKLDETLFVEHKSDLHADSAYNVASTVATISSSISARSVAAAITRFTAPTNATSSSCTSTLSTPPIIHAVIADAGRLAARDGAQAWWTTRAGYVLTRGGAPSCEPTRTCSSTSSSELDSTSASTRCLLMICVR